MNTEGIMLSEMSQTEKHKIPYDFTYMWNLKNKSTPYRKERDSQRTRWWLCGVGVGGLSVKGER